MMTLLDMVQNILSALNADPVNTISETVASEQVAEIVKETYFDIFNDVCIAEREGIIKLDPLSDPLHPNYLKCPQNAKALKFIKYSDNRDTTYRISLRRR